MRKKIWMVFGVGCAFFLLLGVVQGIRKPEVLKEGLTIISGYELSFDEKEDPAEGTDQ